MLRLIVSLMLVLAAVITAAIATTGAAHAQEPLDETALDGTQSEPSVDEGTDEAASADDAAEEAETDTGPPAATQDDESTAPATEPASEHLAQDEPASDAVAEPSIETPDAAAIAADVETEASEAAEAASDDAEQASTAATVEANADTLPTADEPASKDRTSSALNLPSATSAGDETESATTQDSAGTQTTTAAAEAEATADAAVAEVQASAEAAEEQADATVMAAQTDAEAAAAETEAAAAEAEAQASQTPPGVPEPEVIEAMIEVLLEVRAEMTDPEAIALIDEAIAVLQQAYADAVAAAQEAQNDPGSGDGDSTATSPDTGDVNADAESGDTGDASAEAGGDAQSGDTGDSTAGGEADTDPPPPDEDPPPDDGGGQCPQGSEATTQDTAADNSAAVPFACENPGNGGSGRVEAPQISCIDEFLVGESPISIVAGRSSDQRSIVAQLQQRGSGLWMPWIVCPRAPAFVVVDEPDAPTVHHARPLAPAPTSPAIAQACDHGCSFAPAIGATVRDVAGVSSDPDGGAADNAVPAAPQRHVSPEAARAAMSASSSFGNSRTSDASASGWSAQAWVTPAAAFDFVLSYGHRTTGSTDPGRSRSDQPLTPPG